MSGRGGVLGVWSAWVVRTWVVRTMVVWTMVVWAFAEPGTALAATPAEPPALGLLQLAQPDGGQVTVFYPADGVERPLQRGPFVLSVAEQAPVRPGNARLVVISHGSGGSPWVHADLARALVVRGYTVALPQHRGDNYLDDAHPGPVSWRLRPQEVSTAIDLVGQHPTLAQGLDLRTVGVFGGSAGGHTALSMAGGTWSDAGVRAHCEQHLRDDFSSCVGFTTMLRGNLLDGAKLWLARQVIDLRFRDPTLHAAHDPRVRAVVAMVPYAADFDRASLREPRVPLGLVLARLDRNQVPRFHVERVLEACAPRCEVVMDLPDAGHGAMLSPMPAWPAGSIAEHLLADPPGFDRARAIPLLNAHIADFFDRHLRPTAGLPR